MKIIKKQLDIFVDKTCFVFDFDGVIKDSIDVKTKAFQKIYEKEDSFILKKIREFHLNNGGVSRIEKFKYYEEVLLHNKVDEEKINKLCEEFSSLVKDEVVKCRPIPGVIKFLNNLRQKNKLILVNSATPLDELKEIILRCNYQKYFESVYGSPLTKSENLRSIIDDFEIKSDDIIFFGDAKSDLFAAKELKIAFVGVGSYLKEMSKFPDKKNIFINNFNQLI